MKMTNFKIQMTNEIQMSKSKFWHLSFVIDLTFGLCHLKFGP